MKQEFTQAIKNSVNEIIRDMHTVIPGKIIEFDAERCEASIQPTAKFRKPSGELMDFARLNQVPIFFMQGMGQKSTIIYPIEKGDECLIFFCEQALDQWRTGEQSATELRFDLSNAVAIVGMFSKPNPVIKRASENGSIIIQREDTFVEFYDGKFEALVRHKDTAADAYHLMIDGEKNTLDFIVKNEEKETVKFNLDGNTGQIDVATDSDINVKSEKNISVTAEQDITVKATKTININADADLNITSDGAMTISSETSIKMTAPRIDLN